MDEAMATVYSLIGMSDWTRSSEWALRLRRLFVVVVVMLLLLLRQQFRFFSHFTFGVCCSPRASCIFCKHIHHHHFRHSISCVCVCAYVFIFFWPYVCIVHRKFIIVVCYITDAVTKRTNTQLQLLLLFSSFFSFSPSPFPPRTPSLSPRVHGERPMYGFGSGNHKLIE